MKIIAFLSLLFVLIYCTKREKTFISTNKWCQLEYPANWNVIEEENGAYLFLDENHWNGNFRVTPMRKDGHDNIDIQSAIEKDVHKNPGAKIINLGQKRAVYYISKTTEEGDQMIIHNWLTGDKSTLFICSFAVDFKRINEPEVVEELENCRRVLITLKSL